jgi:hypothetical protein
LLFNRDAGTLKFGLIRQDDAVTNQHINRTSGPVLVNDIEITITRLTKQICAELFDLVSEQSLCIQFSEDVYGPAEMVDDGGIPHAKTAGNRQRLLRGAGLWLPPTHMERMVDGGRGH